MIGFGPIAELPISAIQAHLLFDAVQIVTARYASRTFTTRESDSPALVTIDGRIKSISPVERGLSEGEGGQFGSLIRTTLGDIELDNIDGGLDPLVNDYFADGRPIVLKIGATEMVRNQRVMPRYIATGMGAASADASVPYEIAYPTSIVLFEEDFTGTNGAVWPTVRWETAEVTSTSIVDIQGNQGRIIPQGAAFARGKIISKSGNLTDFDLRATFELSSTGDQAHNLNMRASGGWAASNAEYPQNGYSVRISGFSNVLNFDVATDGVIENLRSIAKTWGTDPWDLRILCVGTSIQIKAWPVSDPEPVAWDITEINSDHAGGAISFGSVNGAAVTAREILWDSLVVESVGSTHTVPGDLFVAQLTVNDRGEAGQLSAVPEPWEVLDEATDGPLYQALLYHFAAGDEAGQSALFDWESGDAANDVITGRIFQFRYVDPDQPFEGLTEPVIGDLDSISLPTVVTTERNSLATYWASWADNVSTVGPAGETGGTWINLGNLVSTAQGDDAANRRAGAEMVEPGTISGGSISTTPTDTPQSEVSLLVGVAMRGLPVEDVERVKPFSTFATVYTAIAGPWSFERDVLRLKIQDLSSKLKDKLQVLTYSGTGGINGTADMAGRSKPLAFGHCPNVPAQLVEPSLLIYQLHSGTLEEVETVYDRGVEVPFEGTDYPSYAALAAAAVSPGIPGGTYATSLAAGMIALGTPSSAVTANVLGDAGGYVDTHAGIIERFLSSPLSDEEIDGASYVAAAALQPAEIGILFPAGDQSTVEEAIETVAFSGGFFAGQDRSGLHRIARLDPPSAVPHWVFDDRSIVEIDRIEPAYGVPWRGWAVGYARNWTVQRGSELADAVSQDRRVFLEDEYRRVFRTSTQVALLHASSSTAPFRRSLFVQEADAAAEAERLVGLYRLGAALYRVVVKNVLFSALIGDTVRLIFPRYNLGSGRNFVVTRVRDDADLVETELLVYG